MYGGLQKPSISWQEKLQHGGGLDVVNLEALAAFTAVDSDDEDNDDDDRAALGGRTQVRQAGLHNSVQVLAELNKGV